MTVKKRGRPQIPPDRIAAAKILYEGTPRLTLTQVAKSIGCGASSIKTIAASQNWVKKYQAGEMTAEAHAVADEYLKKTNDIGAEVAAGDPPVEAVVSEMVHDLALNVRSELLKKHREEWKIARGMSSEAVVIRNSDPLKAFERAKLAKITAETIKLVQEGERKAYGLDPTTPDGHVLIIDRGSNGG